jgi:hypothetical protein
VDRRARGRARGGRLARVRRRAPRARRRRGDRADRAERARRTGGDRHLARAPVLGAGVNTEAKALLARLAFDGCGLQRLGAYASTENPRSQAALAKVGFTREGTLRSFHRFGGRAHDVHVYALLREEFAAGPLAAVAAEVGGQPPPRFAATSAARPS